MAKEILPDGLTDGLTDVKEKKSFREKMGDRIGALLQSKEEKRVLVDEKNEKLVERFQEDYGKHFESRVRCKTVEFNDFDDLLGQLTYGPLSFPKSKRELGDEDKSYTKIKVLNMKGFSFPDFEYILKHINIGVQHLYLEFPVAGMVDSFTSENIFKIFEKFIVSKGGISGCCFDFNDRSFREDDLKNLLSWFTKNGKSGKIRDSVIKVNGKDYHSSGDYRYEFN